MLYPSKIIFITRIVLLVGGIPTPLKNMSSSVGMMTFPIFLESQKSYSKPPISLGFGAECPNPHHHSRLGRTTVRSRIFNQMDESDLT
jgi:hypothetical protein